MERQQELRGVRALADATAAHAVSEAFGVEPGRNEPRSVDERATSLPQPEEPRSVELPDVPPELVRPLARCEVLVRPRAGLRRHPRGNVPHHIRAEAVKRTAAARAVVIVLAAHVETQKPCRYYGAVRAFERALHKAAPIHDRVDVLLEDKVRAGEAPERPAESVPNL